MSPKIFKWAIKHSVGMEALHELREIFGMNGGLRMPAAAKGAISEAAVQSVVRLEASRVGVSLFRNNVGALLDIRGVPVRYGLGNDNSEINDVLKSADLIGWRPVLITAEHVGTCIAQFVSREIKEHGWHYVGTERERAQLAWAKLVVADGGDASFASGEGTL